MGEATVMLNNLLDVARRAPGGVLPHGQPAPLGQSAAAIWPPPGYCVRRTRVLGDSLTRADAAELLDGALDVVAAREDDGWFPW